MRYRITIRGTSPSSHTTERPDLTSPPIGNRKKRSSPRSGAPTGPKRTISESGNLTALRRFTSTSGERLRSRKRRSDPTSKRPPAN